METDILRRLKTLERESRQQLASLRRSRRSMRPKLSHTQSMRQHIQARQSGHFETPGSELFAIHRLLDRDDLSAEERKAFSARRRWLIAVGS